MERLLQAVSTTRGGQLRPISWVTLDGSIHAATFLASRTGSGTHCRLCADSDHLAHEYALAPMLSSSQPTRYTASQPSFRKALPGGTSNTSNRPSATLGTGGSVRTCLSAPTNIYAPLARKAPTMQARLPPHSARQHFSPSSFTTSARQQGDQMTKP